MTLYDYCVSFLDYVDRNYPVTIYKLYESVLDDQFYYELVYEGRFEDIPLKYLRYTFDNMLIEKSNRCINFAVYE